MDAQYHPGLVALSLGVAFIASLTALDMAGRLRATKGIASHLWLTGGAFSMGVGIWSMHFIGMLAMDMSTHVMYDIPLTLVSFLAAILTSGLALAVVRNGSPTAGRLAVGALLMGAGVCIMHYVGMEAMQMHGELSYDPLIFACSVLIAVGASAAALWLVFSLNPVANQRPSFWFRVAAGMVMAVGIAGMHYTGMAATIYPEGMHMMPVDGLSPGRLAVSVASVSVSIMLSALVLSIYDTHLTSKSAQLAASLSDANRELKSMVYRDSLTTLPNRLHFEEKIEELLQQGSDSFSLFFVDLDHFKNVNDSLGHHVGDLLIRQSADRLRAAVRETDLVARVGGDEFMVLIQGNPSRKVAESLAFRIVESLQQPFQIEDMLVHVSSSVGVSMYPDHAAQKHELMIYADAAMYAAKKSGRNNYVFYQENMTSGTERRSKMDERLRLALLNDGLSLAYQPKVEVNSGKVTGVEALVRWQDDVLGTVTPDELIPFAEDSNLILPLGEWVLRKACQFSANWEKEFGVALPIAVNISALQLSHRGFVESVKLILEETGLAANRLELELTESTLVKDPKYAQGVMSALRDAGVSLSIDDFGTGYSNLAQLRRFPIDRLKIDKSFMSEAVFNDQDAAIVKSVIALAKILNLKVTTEGIETEEQLEFIRSLNGQEYQGYYYSKALPADELKTLLLKKLAQAS